MNLFNIPTQIKLLKEGNYDTLYWAIDIHGTILKPTYELGLSKEFYKDSIVALQTLSHLKEMKLILFTCSYPSEIKQYLEIFEENAIHFDYVNENPEVENTKFGYFEKKFYANIILDDKAGFEGEKDWSKIQKELDNYISYKRKSDFQKYFW